ncbi:MAG: DUF4058 family protein, partial [Burkholderiales bacterium]|nr:DUF4058 family protein [Anaerolineae bacterium]
MSVRSVKNQYLGINVHLHSLWQARGGWPEFHTRYLVNLADVLLPTLLAMGYSIRIESSIQIPRFGVPTGPNKWIAEKELRALTICDNRTGEEKLVARLEMLSPSNKHGSFDSHDYLMNRRDLVDNGIVFIEMDFLYEMLRPEEWIIPELCPYFDEPISYPYLYYIFITDPRPCFREGTIKVHGFDVDQPIPTLEIALNDDDMLTIDYGELYNQTVEASFYGPQYVDYSELPEN